MSELELLLKEGINFLIHEKYESAIEKFNQALELNPKSAEVYILRGGAEYKIDNIQAAIADYTQARQINPNSTEADLFEVSVLDKPANIQAAIADYIQVCKFYSSLENQVQPEGSLFYEDSKSSTV